MSGNPRNIRYPLTGYSLSLDDILRIYRILQRQVNMAAYIEVSHIRENYDGELEEISSDLEYIKNNCYNIWITVEGRNGTSYFGSDDSIFHSDDLPKDIQSIFMSSINPYKSCRNGMAPRNGFDILFDFSKPPLFDWRNPVSWPTVNNSNMYITSDDLHWSAATQHSVFEVLNDCRVRRAFLHKPFVYDLGLWLFCFPVLLYLAVRMSHAAPQPFYDLHTVVRGGIYIYAFLFGVNFYRLIFGYTKWAFPPVELNKNSSRAKTHRRFWYTIVTGFISALTYAIVDDFIL